MPWEKVTVKTKPDRRAFVTPFDRQFEIDARWVRARNFGERPVNLAWTARSTYTECFVAASSTKKCVRSTEGRKSGPEKPPKREKCVGDSAGGRDAG